MKISLSDFLLLTISVFVGTLGAIAVAGWFAKREATAALAAAQQTPAARLLSFLG